MKKKNICGETTRVAILPNIRLGGSTVDRCENPCLEGFTKCAEHLDKEPLIYQVKFIQSKVKEQEDVCRRMREQVRSLKKEIKDAYSALAEEQQTHDKLKRNLNT